MGIFDSLNVYGSKWNVINTRSFTSEEKNVVASAHVVPSEFGHSVCFMMKSGGSTYIPVGNNVNCNAGDSVNLDNAKIVTLEREGKTINRVEF